MSKRILSLLIASMLMACSSGPPPMPAPSRPPPVTAHTLDPYPEKLPPPMDATGPALLADHVALARLYHRLRAEAETWVAWMLAGPIGGGGE